jgi:nicotinamide riboside kinase
MLIGFTGAQCTGKTTLLNRCKQLLPDWNFVDEVTRKVQREGQPINEHGDDTTQLFILSEHLNNHFKSKQNTILDRCILDGYVYTKWLEQNGNVETWVREHACKMLTHMIDQLDVVFYTCPEDIPLVDDGVRSTNGTFREEIIQLYNELFDQNYYWMDRVIKLRGTVEERLDTILKTIDESTEIRQQQDNQTLRANVRV